MQKKIKGTSMKIKITTQGLVITALLNNSSPAKDLISKLPLTLSMQKHQNREYYTDILLAKDSPSKDGYAIGDISYWKSGNSLVFFYDRGYTSNLIKMGEIITGLEKLSQLPSNITVTIELLKD